MTNVYPVKKGDTLWGIARANHTTVDELVKLNPNLKKNPNLIKIGEKIKLPAKSAEEVDMTVKGLTVEPEKEVQKPAKRTPKKDNTLSFAGESWGVDKNKYKAQEKVEFIIDRYNSNPVFGKKELAKKIIDAADIVGIPADSLAAIVKRESTFKPLSETVKRTRRGLMGGPMGITDAPPKDMYQEHRAGLYDSKLSALIKQYGSLEGVFEAKRREPTLQLGDFGEMLFKYKDARTLQEACAKDYDLNLKVGAYYYKLRLKNAKGNERTAFKTYNIGTPSYARDAMNIVTNARKQYG